MPDQVLLAALTLARARYDRLAERRTDADYLAGLWRAGSPARVLLLQQGRAPVDDGGLVAVGPDRLDALGGVRVLLGTDDGVTYLAVLLDSELGAADVDRLGLGSAGWLTLREAGATLGARDSGLLVTAVALSNWHSTHPCCPRCGAPTVPTNAGWARHCEVDGSDHFPRHDPAVIVLVRDAADRALLGRRADWQPGWYSTLAGFVEAGESAEMTVLREMAEEAGIRIDPDRLDYLGSQPWPFPSSLMLGYHAWVAADSPPAVADGDEISEVRWFTREQMATGCESGTVRLPGQVSIARRLVERWYGSPLPGEWSRP